MDILGNVAHDGVGAVLDTEIQHTVGHHAEILGLVNDHMVGFADDLRFLYPFIKIGKSRQVIDIEGGFGDFHTAAFDLLADQKILIQFKDRLFPLLRAEFSTVCALDCFALEFGVGDFLSQKLVL